MEFAKRMDANKDIQKIVDIGLVILKVAIEKKIATISIIIQKSLVKPLLLHVMNAINVIIKLLTEILLTSILYHASTLDIPMTLILKIIVKI